MKRNGGWVLENAFSSAVGRKNPLTVCSLDLVCLCKWPTEYGRSSGSEVLYSEFGLCLYVREREEEMWVLYVWQWELYLGVQ